MENGYYSVHYLNVRGVGMLTPGEFLTEKHTAALGKKRLQELIDEGEVKAVGIAPVQSETTDNQEGVDGDTEQEAPEGGTEEQVDPENPPMDNSDEEEGEEPEPLDIPADLVNDATEDAQVGDEPKKPKTAGRRKAK